MKAEELYCLDEVKTVSIIPVIKRHVSQFIHSEKPHVRHWLKAQDFDASSGQVCLLADDSGHLSRVFLGMDSEEDCHAVARAATSLPVGNYRFASSLSVGTLCAWGLSQYQFSRYKKASCQLSCLALPDLHKSEVLAQVNAIFLVRDLINTPTNDMGPEELSEAMQVLATVYDADFKEIVGDELLVHNFPAIHAVGRASVHSPRLLELNWGDEAHPRVSLVGKGVCFDSGGLDLKPSSGMRFMKKDMGGAAHVLGLAQWIMSQQLPLRIQVLIPAVENSVAGNSYRPGDILTTRKGLSVEVGNTDAEGRLVLADALHYACESAPELLIDFATLTGAARVAVGTDIAAMFCNDDARAAQLNEASIDTKDALWRLPLHKPYLDMIKPRMADLCNSGSSPYAGAITAGLFLEQFIEPDIAWVHFDVMAWNPKSRPGRPEGGEALGLVATFHLLKTHLASLV